MDNVPVSLLLARVQQQQTNIKQQTRVLANTVSKTLVKYPSQVLIQNVC